MELDYRIFASSEKNEGTNKKQNYFDFNPHLKFLVQRNDIGDKELAHDILKMVGELSAQHLSPKAVQNDKDGCQLEWHVGDQTLSQSDFQKFNEIKDQKSFHPSDPDCELNQAVHAYRKDNSLPIYSEVILPAGAQAQMNLLREHDLIGISLPEKYGGNSLSHMVNGAALLFYSQADAALLLRAMLTEGVAELIDKFGNNEVKNKYLPLLCSGNPQNHFIGAMMITEPNAGSDLREITVKAIKKGEQYFLGGRKIFITNPDADVSIVLARVDGAPHGTLEGLSLFLVPKFIENVKGERIKNKITIENLEEKLGIHASPTGSVLFKNAHAYLIGREGEGLKQMLHLMNKSRLGIGVQGVGIAERAFLESAAFCMERKQFGKILADLPLMREILVNMRIEIEGATSLIFKAYNYIDQVEAIQKQRIERKPKSFDNKKLEHLQKVIRILTPMAKYQGSELGVSMADWAVSNFGGYGYINEFKVERLIRDAKIATLYEGTNNMMVLDVQRSIEKEGTLEALLQDLESSLDQVHDKLLLPYLDLTRQAMNQIKESYEKIGKSQEPKVTAQVEARKFSEFLITTYQAGLMLEEGQYLSDTTGNWRKSIMAVKFIDDKLSPPGKNITSKVSSVEFFQNIFYNRPLNNSDLKQTGIFDQE